MQLWEKKELKFGIHQILFRVPRDDKSGCFGSNLLELLKTNISNTLVESEKNGLPCTRQLFQLIDYQLDRCKNAKA